MLSFGIVALQRFFGSVCSVRLNNCLLVGLGVRGYGGPALRLLATLVCLAGCLWCWSVGCAFRVFSRFVGAGFLSGFKRVFIRVSTKFYLKGSI